MYGRTNERPEAPHSNAEPVQRWAVGSLWASEEIGSRTGIDHWDIRRREGRVGQDDG